ncbi:MAG TPA: glycosyltransferase family 4 protein [Bacteroidia bacterium]|jgi:glycosyltransferase involved in cell wall biosynthesis|nr:glycosyltransferase family 4 protein [Bacteroidia bacterium]
MKLALLTDGIFPYVIGGMQKHSYCLARYLAREKVYIDLYHCIPSGAGNKGALFTPEEERYIRLIPVDFPEKGFLPGHYLHESFAYSTRIWEAFQKNDPVDYVYAKGFTAWKMLDAKSKGARLPPIGVNFHGYEMFQQAASLRSRMEQYLLKGPVRYSMKQADHLFSYGGKITELLLALGVERQKIIQIPGGIEKEWVVETPSRPGSVRRFIFAGRYERRKGIEELTRVLDEWSGPEIQFVFAGPIPASGRIKRSWINYEGRIDTSDRMKILMRSSDILVCPSHSEGMPNVILEGMASGLAIVASDVGAVREMVEAENGWLTEAGNRMSLQKAMQEAAGLDTESLFQKRVCSVKRVREHFLWDILSGVTLHELELKVQQSR